MRRTRPVAGADFNGGNFLLYAEVEHLLMGISSVQVLIASFIVIFLLSLWCGDFYSVL